MANKLCSEPSCPAEAVAGAEYCSLHLQISGAQLITSQGQQKLKQHLKKLAVSAATIEKMKSAPTVKIPNAWKAMQDQAKTQIAAEVKAAATVASGPKTQKAKGIKTLQKHGHLGSHLAIVALTEPDAVSAGQKLGLPCFCRPCPVTPRHGFVDSRVVKSEQDIRQVWSEAKAADPDAELILMLFIEATHNMVWRPGLLSVGPGHDGATAGHDSISVFLQPEYAGSWKAMSAEAGVKLDSQDPFIEAVAGPAHETVLTQIRGGVKGAVTEPNWSPEAFTIGEIITIDDAHKKNEGAMLAWEEQAKTLKPNHHVVYNPGGNLGDHWSVHAQIAGIAVVTDFQPTIGQLLPKMGIDLPPLEPQAIIFGFLGGVLQPDLLPALMRKRAVCAALLGSHHGMRMGGDSGVYIGASVAMMLRLGQAAIWGEARHAKKTGLQREQIYQSILNDWLKGRQGLKANVALFYTHKWAGGFGGKAWAACGKGTTDLDAFMLQLICKPTIENAKAVLAALTNVVNLAHNNGWWLNKFITPEWFDLAAGLDPRPAVMAGPVWYDSAMTPLESRMQLLQVIEKLQPIDLSDIEEKTYAVSAGKVAQATIKKSQQKLAASLAAEAAPSGTSMNEPKAGPGKAKVGSFGTVEAGARIKLPFVAGAALCSVHGSLLHVQIANDTQKQYVSGEISGLSQDLLTAAANGADVPSLSGSGATYQQLAIESGALMIPNTVILAILQQKGK